MPWVLSAIAFLFLGLVLVLPIGFLIVSALSGGWHLIWDTVSDPYALAALKLTGQVTVMAVLMNTVFGVSAAWAIAKCQFRGKIFLSTLIDLPLSISPVVTGMLLVFAFGSHSLIGQTFARIGIPIIFATPGIVLATTFISLPYVVRILVPVMRTTGTEEEEAAMTLGASGFQLFRRITLPNIKWGLVYGVMLCTARALGEFGAVSVVSGHIEGMTNTVPLHVESLFNSYNLPGALAMSSLLLLIALVTLALQSWIENRMTP